MASANPTDLTIAVENELDEATERAIGEGRN
jgi:hypothetical protein